MFRVHLNTGPFIINKKFYLKSDAKRPRIVKRGIDEVAEKIEADEIDQIDHLCFVIHGIGEGCDMKFRPIEDCGIFVFTNNYEISFTFIFQSFLNCSS